MILPFARRAAWLVPLLAAAAVPVGCDTSPVTWTSERRVAASPAAVRVSADGALMPDSMLLLAQQMSPPGPACRGSLRVSRARGTVFAIWWAPRPDSAAWLLSSSTSDAGRHWSPPAAVDTTDRSVSGCRREPPSIAADSLSGYVHVTYALQAPEGSGLFFSHSMDGGRTFHSPVAVMYGDRLGRTSVASDGDAVIVAFEDPNSDTPRIGIALSRTMGHIFEDRLLPVSDDQGIASRPLVAVRGRQVAVSWEQRGSETAVATRVVRVGVLR